METIKHLDLFSGLAGFAIGLKEAGGYETVAFCEIDKFCQKVLAMNHPDIPIFGDIHGVTRQSLSARGIGQIDIITAGFPCQPFSNAGKRGGTTDERFLWKELYRVIQDTQPRCILLENVTGLLTSEKGRVFTGILYDLYQAGYDAEWCVIPASAVGAQHRRNRVWISAYANRVGLQGRISQPEEGQEWRSIYAETLPLSNWWRTHDIPQTRILRVVDGIRDRIHQHRNKALGNAIVPQIVTILGNRIRDNIFLPKDNPNV